MTDKMKVELAIEALQWIANNAGRIWLCEPKCAPSCLARCDIVCKAMAAIEQLTAEEESLRDTPASQAW